MTGIPERTLSVWLSDERYAEERRAVQAGLLQSVQEDAAHRGAELVEATREAILVCRKSLRKDPDGRTASSLLSALSRARESEDRIQRLDQGSATEICGIQLSPEDREAFAKWHAERLRTRELPTDQLHQRLNDELLELLPSLVTERAILRGLMKVLANDAGAVIHAMGEEVELARRLHAVMAQALAHAERQARNREVADETAAGRRAAPSRR